MKPFDRPEDLASIIDHTFLKSHGPPGEIEQVCREAAEHGFATVAVNPAEVEHCIRLLAGSPVRVCAAIGFPYGQTTSETKAFEIRDAIQKGAHEVDMVINIRALQGGAARAVEQEIGNLGAQCRESGAVSKVILETCYLDDAEKEKVCGMAVRGGVDFVKTSSTPRPTSGDWPGRPVSEPPAGSRSWRS